jgi:hypothetical protein
VIPSNSQGANENLQANDNWKNALKKKQKNSIKKDQADVKKLNESQ